MPVNSPEPTELELSCKDKQPEKRDGMKPRLNIWFEILVFALQCFLKSNVGLFKTILVLKGLLMVPRSRNLRTPQML